MMRSAVFWGVVGVAAGRSQLADCNCGDSTEPIWAFLLEASRMVKTRDPHLRTSEVHEVCRVAYPHIFRSFTTNATLDTFTTLTDCPLGLSTAALFCAQSVALKEDVQGERSESLNLLDVALRSWEWASSDCVRESQWPVSLGEVMTQFRLILESRETWKFLATEFPIDDRQKLFNIRWVRGVEAEADFWRGKFKPNVEDQEDWENFHVWISDPSKYVWFRHDSPCDYVDFASRAPGVVRVLNAGSGPFVPDRLECVKETYADQKVYPTALYNADGLGRYYMSMHAKFVTDRVTPPIFSCAVEEIYKCFPENFFDVSHMQNALDHAYDPMAGISQLLFVTKSGGRVILRHAENEGVPGGFIFGLHQWAFTANEQGDFVIWNPHRVVNVSERLQGQATVTTRKVPQPWGSNPHAFFIFVELTKL